MAKGPLSLFTERYLEVTTGLPSDVAREKLSASIGPGELRGSIGPQGIVLRLDGQGLRHPYQPVFRGSLTPAGRGAQLNGTIRSPNGFRFVALGWLAMALIWTVGALVATHGAVRMVPLVGIGMFAAGLIALRIINIFIGRVAEKLDVKIREAMAAIA